MIVVGVRCTKDTLDWVVVDGAERSLASITEQRKVTAPAANEAVSSHGSAKRFSSCLSATRLKVPLSELQRAAVSPSA